MRKKQRLVFFTLSFSIFLFFMVGKTLHMKKHANLEFIKITKKIQLDYPSNKTSSFGCHNIRAKKVNQKNFKPFLIPRSRLRRSLLQCSAGRTTSLAAPDPMANKGRIGPSPLRSLWIYITKSQNSVRLFNVSNDLYRDDQS